MIVKCSKAGSFSEGGTDLKPASSVSISMQSYYGAGKQDINQGPPQHVEWWLVLAKDNMHLFSETTAECSRKEVSRQVAFLNYRLFDLCSIGKAGSV